MEFHEKHFERQNFTSELPGREFSNCSFLNCNLEKANLSSHEFIECEFENCNLSMADLKSTGLKDVKFKDCKLNGMDFSPCNDFLFAVQFTGCSLDYAAFQKKKMKKTVFTDCSIREAHFFETDLSECTFGNCDLSGTYFEKCDLQKADLRTAKNYSIDPSANKMKKAKVSVEGLPGLVSQFGLIID